MGRLGSGAGLPAGCSQKLPTEEAAQVGPGSGVVKGQRQSAEVTPGCLPVGAL